jgi:hypothetical protein
MTKKKVFHITLGVTAIKILKPLGSFSAIILFASKARTCHNCALLKSRSSEEVNSKYWNCPKFVISKIV